jgi:hypothetical protein
MLGTTMETQIPIRGEEEMYIVQCGGKWLQVAPDTPLETFEAVHPDGAMERSVRRSPAGSSKAKVEPGTPVFLLFLGYSRGPTVKLKYDSRLPAPAYLVLGRSPTDTDKYERVGILFDDFLAEANVSGVLEHAENPDALKDFSEAVITVI